MTVCLENGAWIVEAQGFFMRHQFRLSSKLMNAPWVRFTSFWWPIYPVDIPHHTTPQNLRARSGGRVSAPSADFPASVTQAAAGERPSPSGGRFAVRPCPDGLACVVTTAGDGERDGGIDSSSRDGELPVQIAATSCAQNCWEISFRQHICQWGRWASM